MQQKQSKLEPEPPRKKLKDAELHSIKQLYSSYMPNIITISYDSTLKLLEEIGNFWWTLQISQGALPELEKESQLLSNEINSHIKHIQLYGTRIRSCQTLLEANIASDELKSFHDPTYQCLQIRLQNWKQDVITPKQKLQPVLSTGNRSPQEKNSRALSN